MFPSIASLVFPQYPLVHYLSLGSDSFKLFVNMQGHYLFRIPKNLLFDNVSTFSKNIRDI